MLGLLGSWANEVPSDSLASYHTTTTTAHEVHVLLVDHERESLASIANMLQMCSYKVTTVELASTALTMLANGGEQFDIVMANIHSPDYQGFRLLETAVNRDMLTILMSVDEEVPLARRALECGAFLYVKKPVSIELVKYLWQHLMKERLRNAAKGTVGERIDSNGRSYESEEESLSKENSDVENDRKNKGKRKARNDQHGSNWDAMNNNGNVKGKVCTEWTKELHAKFTDAVNRLGEGKCYPKDILELMNVPGLTRMQVASHLQKCRNNNWRAPEKRSRAQGLPLPNANGAPKRDHTRRFGIMPRSCMNQPQQPENQERSATLESNSGLGSKIPANGRGDGPMPQFSHGLNPSMQNGDVQLQNIGILSGTSTEGIGIANEKSNGNGNRIPASVALEVNSLQPHGQNLPVFYGPAATVTNSPANSPSRRQIAYDFFEFPDTDYIEQNISEFHQGSDTNHAQSQQALNQVYPEQVPMTMNKEARCPECGAKAAKGGNQKCRLHE